MLVDKSHNFGATHLASLPGLLQQPINCEHQTVMDTLMSTIRYISQVSDGACVKSRSREHKPSITSAQHDIVNVLPPVTAAYAASSNESFGPGWCRYCPLESAQTRCDITLP